MASNKLSGEIPDFSIWLPNLQELDLSRQSAGFSGTIPARLSNLPFLATLSIAGNSLTGIIPPAFGNFAQLKALHLSDNELSQTIPAELGKLAGTLEVFDASRNQLTGKIPEQLGLINKVQLKRNPELLLSATAQCSKRSL